MNRTWRWPLLFSGLFLLAQAWPISSPVRNAATLEWATGFHLQYPLWHLVLTPFCSLADYITTLSLRQLEVLLGYVMALLFLISGWRRRLYVFMGLLIFLAWAILIPRPMGRLVAKDPDTLLIDFHSHTRYSHDGRPSFTPQANQAWHAQQGYGAAFITDHNRVEAADMAKADSRTHWQRTGYRSLKGEEISLEKTHLVVLGNKERIDNQPFDSDPAKIPLFIAYAHKQHLPVIASLPEYWLYHWPAGVDQFINWGIDGFEIVNSAPKALDFPIAYRRQIVELCRLHNRFMTGISDTHGYGYATAAWNAMTLPGWQAMDPDALESAVLRQLRKMGFQAVTVLERSRFLPKNDWQLAISPLMHFSYYLRLLEPIQSLIWCLWLGGLVFIRRFA